MASLPPLTPTTVLTEWTFDPLAAVFIVAAAVAYAIGVRRLRDRHRSWAVARSASFAIGLIILTIATQSGLARYDTVLFGAHVLQHILLGLAAPFFLALGAPVTLAMQASERGTQVNLIKVVRSRPVRAIGHPVVAWSLFAVSMFLLYFSPLYELSLRNDVVHAWVHVHFLFVGSLFFWVVIGLDPVAHRLSYGARLILVLLTVPFHAFLGIALMSAHDPLAATYYAEQVREGQPPVLEDQRSGGALMWMIGDVVGLAAGGVIVAQWVRAEERKTKRLDRRLDAQEAAAAGSEDPHAAARRT